MKEMVIKSNRGGVLFIGDSMLPALRSGDRIKIIPTAPLQITPGDIAVLRQEKIVCHRIVGKYREKGKWYFLEKGDNWNQGLINIVAAEKVIGKVAAVEKSDGKFLDSRRLANAGIRIRCLMFNIAYLIGRRIRINFFGNHPKGFIRKAGRGALRTLSYLI